MKRLMLLGFLAVHVFALALEMVPRANIRTEAWVPGSAERWQIESIVNAKSPVFAATGFEKLFDKRRAEQIRGLKAHASVGIGLRAAWEEVRISVPEKRQPSQLDVDRTRLSRFIGFVEGRLCISLPPWWEETVLNAQAFERANIFFTVQPQLLYPKRGLGFLMPRDTTLINTQQQAVLQVRGESVRIPAKVLENGRTHSGPCLSAFLDRDRAYVAMQSDCCDPYQLICIDRRLGNIVWEAEVWASGGGIFYCGPSYHVVSISVADQRVLVFGAGPNCVYVEGFAVVNGTPLFRFSTSY
jgi:hypothetical protein